MCNQDFWYIPSKCWEKIEYFLTGLIAFISVFASGPSSCDVKFNSSFYLDLICTLAYFSEQGINLILIFLRVN